MTQPTATVTVQIKHRYTDAVLYTHLRGACRITEAGCWEWALSRTGGRGRMKIGGRKVYAHRAMWEAANGKIPAGLLVLHDCDNSACINPAHLRLGSHHDNMRDMVERGRSTRGRTLSLEHRLKVSLAGRGRRHSDETRARIAAGVRRSMQEAA